jgi:molybdopterin-guanine dinucleotide biosynthesis protein A
MIYKKSFFIFLVLFISNIAYAQNSSVESFTIENYYKVRWGYAEEFISLYKKNHYPLLKKALEKGDLISIKIEKPRQHGAEDGRWDYRITLVFKSVQLAFDPNLTEPYKKAIYPDLEKLKKEEQHRFELLVAHWDLEVQSVDLEK